MRLVCHRENGPLLWILCRHLLCHRKHSLHAVERDKIAQKRGKIAKDVQQGVDWHYVINQDSEKTNRRCSWHGTTAAFSQSVSGPLANALHTIVTVLTSEVVGATPRLDNILIGWMNTYQRHQSLQRHLQRICDHPSDGHAQNFVVLRSSRTVRSPSKDVLVAMNSNRRVYFQKSMNKCHSRRVCSTTFKCLVAQWIL
ncbi:hypothetical protein F5141DRAFT_1097255 [Pisolithus sp. B1]|nr:hypothetical protein F5141DRAFT_1097255 [Pisolithus sp. B1]